MKFVFLQSQIQPLAFSFNGFDIVSPCLLSSSPPKPNFPPDGGLFIRQGLVGGPKGTEGRLSNLLDGIDEFFAFFLVPILGQSFDEITQRAVSDKNGGLSQESIVRPRKLFHVEEFDTTGDRVQGLELGFETGIDDEGEQKSFLREVVIGKACGMKHFRFFAHFAELFQEAFAMCFAAPAE